MNILFYSRNCTTCASLIQIMTNEGLLQSFNLYCVDDHLHDLPPHITEVPTLIVQDINHPLVVGEAFKWVETIKFMNQRNVAEMNKRIILTNMMKNAQMIGPHGYAQTEMGGFSDTFAFTETDHALLQSFFENGSEKENAIFTAPEQEKINDGEQKRRIGEILSSRKEQDKQHSTLMKQSQINAVIESEQNKIREQQYVPRSQQLKMQQSRYGRT